MRHEIRNKRVVNESVIALSSNAYGKIGRKSLSVRVTSLPTPNAAGFVKPYRDPIVQYVVRKGRCDRRCLRTPNYSRAVAYYNSIEA